MALSLEKLTDSLSKLVYDAAGKNIHPTCYRQIFETESSAILGLDEQQWISEGQKTQFQGCKDHLQKSTLDTLQLKDSHVLKNCVVLRVNMLKNHFRRS